MAPTGRGRTYRLELPDVEPEEPKFGGKRDILRLRLRFSPTREQKRGSDAA